MKTHKKPTYYLVNNKLLQTAFKTLSKVGHAYNPSTWEGEAKGALGNSRPAWAQW